MIRCLLRDGGELVVDWWMPQVNDQVEGVKRLDLRFFKEFLDLYI